MMQVNQELCAGCGACMEACCVDAIRLINQHAVIDEARCTHCEACVEACPNGAITAITEPIRQGQIVAVVETHLPIIPTPKSPPAVETTSPIRSLAPAAGAVLAFLGREVAPRLIEVLATALERRLAAPTACTANSLPASPIRLAKTNRGIRRQARYRGRRNSYWNS